MLDNANNRRPVLSSLQGVSLACEAWCSRQPLLVRWAIVFLWYAVIFVLSALPAAASRRTKDMVGGDDVVNMIVRVAAHAFVFGVLATFTYLALNKTFAPHRPRIFLTHLLNTLFGFSDEVHQLYVPGRFFRFQDVATDVVGGVCVLWLVLLWFHSSRLSHLRRSSDILR
jgi:VanZ like family